MEAAFKRTFSSFEVRNFRLFFAGQCISLAGTWMQIVGMSWLVLQLTHSGTQLGLVVAAQFLPVLLFGVLGGVIADRFNKRHVLFITQTTSALLALLLGLLVVTHTVQLWMIYIVAAGMGFTQMVDNPTRQTFVMEMVGRDRLRNAVSLNSTMVNAARIVGPSIAAVLIATVGIGVCFLCNAVSFVAILVALALMRTRELHSVPAAPREPGQIRAGLRYVWSQPPLRAILLMMFKLAHLLMNFRSYCPYSPRRRSMAMPARIRHSRWQWGWGRWRAAYMWRVAAKRRYAKCSSLQHYLA
jgi:MFS family permease